MKRQTFREAGNLSKVNSNYLAELRFKQSCLIPELEFSNTISSWHGEVYVFLKLVKISDFLFLPKITTLCNSRQRNQQVQTMKQDVSFV